MGKLKGKSKSKARRRKRISRFKSKNVWRKKMLAKIRKNEDPILREKCEDTSKDMDNILGFIKELIQVLGISDGVGLSAPQIGYKYKAFTIRPEGKGKSITVMLNPMISEYGTETDWMQEGCLSFPGKIKNIERYKKLKLKYYDKNFNEYTKEFKGLEARIIQHEMDHLKGKCIFGVKEEE